MCAIFNDDALRAAKPGKEAGVVAASATSEEADAPSTSGRLASPEQLTQLCGRLQAEEGLDALVAALDELMPPLSFKAVLSRGGWYRLGGVVDRSYQRISGNIREWVEQECGEDVDDLIVRYAGEGYFATRLVGQTHFITAALSDSPQDFVQIEIEQLQETIDRPLVDSDWFPDSVEEFLEPIDYPRLDPEPISKPFFQFRRISRIADLISSAGSQRKIADLRRFFADWETSSASAELLCHHWVLALREYRDEESQLQLTAKPVAVFAGERPEAVSGDELKGSSLAKAIHHYDHDAGYPFAWYFNMLGEKASNFALADAVLKDQLEAYAYLPERDLQVLQAWETRPYAI